jgi:hypothetical protein
MNHLKLNLNDEILVWPGMILMKTVKINPIKIIKNNQNCLKLKNQHEPTINLTDQLTIL